MGAKLSDIRNEYDKSSLSEKHIHSDPVVQLKIWLEEAIELNVLEPTAMIIATVGKDLKPSSRTVLLKEIHEGSLVFYTNYNSRKGSQLAENPNISATIFWKEMQRQIHIEGKTEKVPADLSDIYFDSRPWKSRVGARISPQSQIIKSRNTIKLAFAKEAFKIGTGKVVRPDYWGGYFIIPERIEFWQGRESRLHDRILFTRNADLSWEKARLAP